MNNVIIGVDLGGTNVKTAMVSWDKQVLAKDSRPTNAEGGPEAVMDAIDALDAICEMHRMGAMDTMDTLGMCNPGLFVTQ